MREIRRARIAQTMLGVEVLDETLFFAYVYLDFDFLSAHQSFGGGLREYDEVCRWVRGVLEVADVVSWEKLPGCVIRVDSETSQVYRIGHQFKECWFDLAEWEAR